jgi:hypothetical protein
LASDWVFDSTGKAELLRCFVVQQTEKPDVAGAWSVEAALPSADHIAVDARLRLPQPTGQATEMVGHVIERPASAKALLSEQLIGEASGLRHVPIPRALPCPGTGPWRVMFLPRGNGEGILTRAIFL